MDQAMYPVLTGLKKRREECEKELIKLKREIGLLTCTLRTRFPSVDAAMEARHDTKLSAYYCNLCKGAHLKSKKDKTEEGQKVTVESTKLDCLPKSPAMVAGDRPNQVRNQVDRLIPELDQQVAVEWDSDGLSAIAVWVSEYADDVKEEIARRYALRGWSVRFQNRGKLMQLDPGASAVLELFDKGLVSIAPEDLPELQREAQIEQENWKRLRGEIIEEAEAIEK